MQRGGGLGMIGGWHGSCRPEQISLDSKKRRDRNRRSDEAAEFIAYPTRHIEQDDEAECHARRTQTPHRGAAVIANPKSGTPQYPNNSCRWDEPDGGGVRGIGRKDKESGRKH